MVFFHSEDFFSVSISSNNYIIIFYFKSNLLETFDKYQYQTLIWMFIIFDDDEIMREYTLIVSRKHQYVLIPNMYLVVYYIWQRWKLHEPNDFLLN